MTVNEIRASILGLFGFAPTSDQERALDGILAMMADSGPRQTYVLKGYAGTGKTTLLAAIIRFLDLQRYPCVLMAPTGRAAKVLSAYSGHPATTIHKRIYRQKEVNGQFDGFALNDNLYDRALFIVDEASMISNSQEDASVFGSGRLLDDLCRYVFKGRFCKLILIGDTAQLPPVGRSVSPALDFKVLESLDLNVRGHELRQVVRQAENSQLLSDATDLRLHIASGEVADLPQLSVNQTDVIRLQGEDLIEAITASYQNVGMDECRVVCRSNRRAVLYNLAIRSRILYKEDELSTGDLLLVAKNNYFWSREYQEVPFIANGDLVEVRRVRKTYEMYGFRFADLEVRFPETDWEMEVRVILDSLTAEAPALDEASWQKLYTQVTEDYAHLTNKKELYEALRLDPWLNALQVKYGYAMTCHKSQGGQWKHIFLDQGWVTDEMMGVEYYRWLYTALTRATEKVYLVNFRDEFIAPSR